MADFKMRNFHHFPIEKTSYDLKLEILEELNHVEGLELMKANKGLRSIYLKDPWRIIGRHVHSIRLLAKIEIRKSAQSSPLRCDFRFHLPLFKKIKSCEKFHYARDRRTQQAIDTARKMLSNWISIGKWEYWISDLESFKECFLNFKGQITDCIGMNLEWYSGEENDPNLSFISKVFKTQLGKCKIATVFCRVDQLSNVSKLFSKTRVRRILCRFLVCEQFSATGLEMAMRWIVYNGIPSQNRDAGISIEVRTYGNQQKQHSIADAYHFLDDFLSTFPGMQQMPDEKDIRSYWRKIDDEKDCIYEFGGNEPFIFSAKYVPSQAQ